jgi:hypothetical protein
MTSSASIDAYKLYCLIKILLHSFVTTHILYEVET